MKTYDDCIVSLKGVMDVMEIESSSEFYLNPNSDISENLLHLNAALEKIKNSTEKKDIIINANNFSMTFKKLSPCLNQILYNKKVDSLINKNDCRDVLFGDVIQVPEVEVFKNIFKMQAISDEEGSFRDGALKNLKYESLEKEHFIGGERVHLLDIE